MAESTELSVVVSMVDEISAKLKSIKDKTEEFSESARKVGTVMTATGGIITGVGIKAVTDFSELGDAIEKMSVRTGMSAEAVSALRVAADASGTSIETVENSIKKMQMNMAEAEDGTFALTDSMAAFGIGLSANFIDLDPAAQFEELAQKIGALPDETDRTNAAMAAFGKTGTDLIPMFEDGSFAMDDWKTKAEEMGTMMDDDTAKAAADLNDAMGYLKATISGLWMEVGKYLAPTFTELSDKIQPVIAKITEWMEANPELTKKIELVVLAVGAFLLVLGPLLIALSYLPALIAGVGTALEIFTGPVGWVILAITALIAIGVLLYQNWDTIKAKIEEVKNKITEFLDKHPELVEALNKAKEVIGQVATIIKEEFIKAWDDLMIAIEPHYPELQKLALLLGGALLVAIGAVALSIGTMVVAFGALVLIIMKVVTWVSEIQTAIDDFVQNTITVLSTKIAELATAFSSAWTSISATVTYHVNIAKSVVDGFIDGVVNKIENIKNAFRNAFSYAASIAQSTMGSIGIDIPGFATGVQNFGGGLAVVGEKGPELVNLPAGSDVIPNSALGGLNAGTTQNIDNSKTFNITVNEAEVQSNWMSQLNVQLKTL